MTDSLYHDNLINELSELYGIISEYWNISGRKVVTSLETKKVILKRLGINVDDISEISREINKLRWEKWENVLEPVYIISEDAQPFEIPLYLPIGEEHQRLVEIKFSIKCEGVNSFEITTIHGSDLVVKDVQWINGRRFIKIHLSDRKKRGLGYYDLNLEISGQEKLFDGENILKRNSKIIITPDECYTLHKRSWGLSVNLYSIRSENNWGIGDFGDLLKLIDWASSLKCGFIGINPLHAIPNTEPFGISPYSPISRLYKNFIYLNLNDIDEFNELLRKKNKNLIKHIEKLKKKEFINYEKIADLKLRLLRKCFLSFYKNHFLKNTKRAIEFKNYIESEGVDLELFAIFNVVGELIRRGKKIFDFESWDDIYKIECAKFLEDEDFKKRFKKEILFYQYIQWLIDSSLKVIYEKARKERMDIGLYYDLAVGASRLSSDVWSNRNIFVDGISVGAPPDDFSPDGQNWGLPPMRPDKLRESGYELFIKIIRKNMRYGGAIRIDHALGLFRLFWIPDGLSPKDGAYIKYPAEELIRIIALESILNKVVVIAEDLGTIGENVRETLSKFKMMSYRLFYFERNYPEPSFLSPEKYPEMALCAITTHDLPTLYGYWLGRDIEMRMRYGSIKDKLYYDEQISIRRRDKRLIINALKNNGVLPIDYPEDTDMNTYLCSAIYQYLAMTPCKLLLVSMDDVLGTLDQQNMPGLASGYPSWRRRIGVSLEKIIKDERFVEIALILNKYISKNDLG